ncbi:MAG: 16S rRNA (cytosine(967)-C(5))-methyltransferase RsmB [Rudaea sp.]
MADPRALAARVLAKIVAGQSLRAVFAVTSTQLRDARDRALLSALLHDGARWWLRFEAAIAELLERPLRAADADIHSLLVLGLVQLEILRVPEHAAVAATVEAARALRKPGFAGLINAVLRRWLRERDVRIAQLDLGTVTRSAHPHWLINAIAADWPAQWQAILDANNAVAPLSLRVNRRRIARAEFAAQLRSAGVACIAPTQFADALILAESRDVTALPGYEQGFFSVQDAAAQCAAGLLDLRDGQRVLDACAAPGGKSAHILECADVDLLALDCDARRLPRLRENLARLGLAALVRAGDAAAPASWWDGRAFERILLDAPCSATGIIRRQPDVKLHRRATDIDTLAATQTHLLEALWPMLAPGGRLVYVTCSILAGENARPLVGFLARHADARTLAPGLGWHAVGVGEQNLPGGSDADGFFYAVLEKDN